MEWRLSLRVIAINSEENWADAGLCDVDYDW